jgi:hypothetical protein
MRIAFNFDCVVSSIENGLKFDRHWKSPGVGQVWVLHYSKLIYTLDIVTRLETKVTAILSFPKKNLVGRNVVFDTFWKNIKTSNLSKDYFPGK